MVRTDLMIIFVLAMFFTGVGFVSVYVNEEFGTSYQETSLTTDGEYSSTGILTYLSAIASMFVYSFGILPVWLDIIFISLRLFFWITLVKVLIHG
jgi:hypothetical protein